MTIRIPLTARQSAIAACVLDGLSYRQTAAAVGIQRNQAYREVGYLIDRSLAWDRDSLRQMLAPLNRPLGTGEPTP